MKFPTFILLTGVLLMTACAKDHYIVASTATVIGLELSQNQATQSPQAKLGYNRAELAVVPTNRKNCKADDTNCTPVPSGTNGAADSADVLMELRYGGFSFSGSGGVYQRLAIGKDAVVQPGASLMFAKDSKGNITKDAADAVDSAVNTEAFENGISNAQQKQAKITLILGNVAPGGTLDKTKLESLFNTAAIPANDGERVFILQTTNATDLKNRLKVASSDLVQKLNKAIP